MAGTSSKEIGRKIKRSVSKIGVFMHSIVPEFKEEFYENRYAQNHLPKRLQTLSI